LEPAGTITLTVKLSPEMASIKYLNGAMLTVIILLSVSFLLPHDKINKKISKLMILFIRQNFSQDTKITYNIRKGLCIRNKLI
jgi:hypothetical protein